MTKKYNTPMLQVVGISRNDIIATSDAVTLGAPGSASEAEAPGMRMLDFDAGY